MYQLKKLKSLLLLLCIAVTAKAQLSEGKVYNFVNVGNNTKSLVALSLSDLSIATTDETAAQQLWYVEKVSDGVFALRNLYSGYYLHSPNKQDNTKWTLVNRMEESGRFTCTTAGGGYALRAANTTDNGLYMHYGAGTDRIVCWNANSGTTASHWVINEVEKTATIQELIDNFPDVEAYQEHLNTLFEDKACTRLTSTYSSMNVETLKTQAAYVALPETLQQMVLKVRNGDNSWGEENIGGKPAWDASYAKKYRVQLYEPYSEPNCASTALSLNQHTNLNNPTGIFANDKETFYVMVEGEIKEGASLYLASYTGNGRPGWYADGIKLSEGLNVVTSYGDGTNYCINYVVETFDTSDGKRGHMAKARPLSQFPTLKIHIEGGHINGYYNKVGDALYLNSEGTQGDKNADWDYLEARATQTTVTVLGKYMTLQFPLNDADTEGNKGLGYYLNDRVTVEKVIDSWDNVMMWERLLLGVLDESTTTDKTKNVKSPYSDSDHVFEYTGNDQDFPAGYGDYYNVHGLALGVGGDAYMYGSSDHSGYHYNTMGGVIESMPTNAGSHWGPAHEIGHQHQNLINMRGETEVSNNLFSNMVLWFYGETTSRVNGSEGSLENILKNFNSENGHYLTNSIWGMTHMYYKLFLYYHVLGHNPKFYPRLFEMLRQDPQVENRAGTVDGSKAQLHLYKKVCQAAGEDLTEFFRAHGFFKPLDGYVMGDYGNSTYYMTQDQIDAAIAEVKAMAEENGWKQNIAVLFINDATGETIKSHKGDNLTLYGETTVCAEVGGYASFTDNTTPDYTYSVSGTTVTMEGTGGTGFAIFNEKGEIIAFSDKKTFTISKECAVAIASGKAEIKSVKADNTPVEAVDVMDTNDAEAKYVALGELLDAAKTVTNLADATGTKVGYYRSDLLTDLQDAYEKAKTVYDNKTVASYTAVYDVLYQEYANVVNDDFARIGIIEGNAYRLTNKVYTGRSMSVNANDKMLGENTVDANDAQKWYFEASNSRGRYYLKNKSTGKYPGDVSTSAVLDVNKTEDTKGQENGAYAYELRDMGNGLWALVGSTGLHCSASQSYNIVGWGTDAEATLWYITAVEVDDIAEARDELENLVEKTEAMMAEVGEVAVGETKTVTLTESNYYCNAECKETTYGDQFTSYSVLCDGSSSTFLHTDYSSQAPSEDHYIRIDMGADNGLQYFNLNYTTRGGDGNVCAPTKMSIEVSNDDTNWVTLRDITSGLPITNNASYTIEELGYGTSYRYVRMRVYGTSGSQKANGHYYFILSELGLSMISYAETLNSTYTSMTEGVLLDAFKANLAAQGVLITATTSDEYKAAYTTLETKYNALLAAKKVVDDAALNAKKAELQTLIDNTTSLISSCGTVTYTPATLNGALALQTTNSEGGFYLSTNAQEPKEGPIKNLLTSENTYFHSKWSAAVGAVHHLEVDMGEGYSLKDFTFTYKTSNGLFPYIINVYGSNDTNDTGTLLSEFSKDDNTNALPNEASRSWTSSTISSDTRYRYIRFDVVESGGGDLNPTPTGATSGTEYCFKMSYFGLTAIGTPESYTVELGNDAGGATNALMLAAYKENASAQATHTLATTLSQVEEAIAKLQGDYDALKSAKESTVEKTYYVQVVGGNANGGVEYGGKSYLSSASFEAPINLTVANLTAIPLDGYAEPVVTLNGTTITVTYNKEYTVQVTGGGGNGGVTYNGNDYAHNATITVLQDIDEAQLEAKDVDGYYPGVITVNHETKVITVTYTMTPLVDTEKYYTLECKSSDDHSTERFIGDNRSVIDGRSAEGTRFLFERANDENGYYMKSMISGKYLNHDENNNLYASADRVTVWTIAKTLFESLNYPFTLTVGNNLYLNNYLATDCTDGSCVDLRSNLHNEGVGSGNACSLWTLVEYDEPYDKTELNTLLGEVKGLVASCYTDEVFNYTGSIYVTEALMTATDEKVSAAQTAYDDKTTAKVVYDAALEALQTAKTNLQYAIECALFPVLLTVDPASPELYIIKTKRDGDNMVLQYDEPTELFSVAASVDKEPTQAFYFMKGDGSQVYIYPYMAGGKVLAANEVGNASGTAFAMEKGSATYEQWVFVARADGYYNLQPAGTSTYLSNIYGTSHKMGFYGSNPDTDKGSLFKFESTTVEGSYYYLKLKDYYENQAKVAGSNIQGGEAVGYYPTDKANAYNSAYSNATNVLASATSTDEEYTNAYDALKAANEALVPNMPEEGKFYRFVSADTKNDRVEGVVYANPEDNKMYWSKGKETSDATAIWTIAPADNGTYHITNLHTGTSIGEFIGSNPSPLREEGGAVSIKPLSGDGQVGFISNGTMMHAQGDYSAIVHWETGAGDASAWRIVEVEDMSLVNFALKIGQYRHAGLYLNYATKIPENVKVYIAHTPDGADGSIIAEELEGTILPAHTAVIVQGNQGEYKFKYTTADYDGSEDLKQNLLGGSAYRKYQQVKDGYLCCVFGRLNDEVGLYKNWVQYTDASGSQIDPESKESVADTDRGTHFKVSANKIYYEYEPSRVAGASAFRFRFNSKEEETTTIDELLLLDDTIIYNLYGQRIAKVAEPGIYIVNGKKMYVTEKMIRDND